MLEREENEEADDQMDDPYKSIDTDTAAIITAALETCRKRQLCRNVFSTNLITKHI